jgi:hypothetical protein
MDKSRLKAPRISSLKDLSQCLSEVGTTAVTPSLVSPNSHSNPVSADVTTSQSYFSLKFHTPDISREQTQRWPLEGGELTLFDPSFGSPKEALVDSESPTQARWSLPRLKWCAFCKGEFSTMVEYVPSKQTFWSSVGIFFAGGVLGCFMAPYYINKCKNPQLLCTRCRRPV